MIRKNAISYFILYLLLLTLPIIAKTQESKIITTKFQSKALSGNLLGISDLQTGKFLLQILGNVNLA